MSRTWLVFRNELITVIFRRSFLFTLFLLPLISTIIFGVAANFQAKAGANTPNPVTQFFSPPEKKLAEGFVDQSGIIQKVPDDLQLALLPFGNEAAAKAALTDGKIGAYYLIPADYLQTGKLTYVRNDFNPMGGLAQTSEIKHTLDFNLLKGNVTLLAQADYSGEMDVHYLNQQPERNPDSAVTFFVPYAILLLFYMVILTSSSLMFSSITQEKKNRMLEILMTSMKPVEMLTGKIVALGVVGLLQTVVWFGTGFILLRLSGSSFNLPVAYQLPPSILLWGVIFFVGGYAIYASLMAGVGALVPSMRDGSSVTTVIIIPLMIPLFLLNSLIQMPNGGLAVGLSLFPLTAPMAMMTRLAAATVPLWQLGLAVVLLFATAWLAIRSVAGMFRAQNLLSGQAFSFKIFVRALIGKA